jgi:hypothetical protein
MTVLFGTRSVRACGKFDVIGQQTKDFGMGMNHAGIQWMGVGDPEHEMAAKVFQTHGKNDHQQQNAAGEQRPSIGSGIGAHFDAGKYVEQLLACKQEILCEVSRQNEGKWMGRGVCEKVVGMWGRWGPGRLRSAFSFATLSLARPEDRFLLVLR